MDLGLKGPTYTIASACSSGTHAIGQAFWINTNVTGFSYVNDASGNIQFKATIPPASGTGPGSPTGTVATSGEPSSFPLANHQPALFLFSTLDGTISGWNGGGSAVSAA